jgi:hypothetical protein
MINWVLLRLKAAEIAGDVIVGLVEKLNQRKAEERTSGAPNLVAQRLGEDGAVGSGSFASDDSLDRIQGGGPPKLVGVLRDNSDEPRDSVLGQPTQSVVL